MLVLNFELVHHAGEWCPAHRKETMVEALYRLGEVEVWSKSRYDGTLQDPKMPQSRMKLEHRCFDAEGGIWMEARDSAAGRSEV